MPVIPSTAGSVNKRIAVQSGLGKKQEPIFKRTTAERVGGVTQAVEHLPSKCETLTSNTSTNQREK
jgi:hypothetical protein